MKVPVAVLMGGVLGKGPDGRDESSNKCVSSSDNGAGWARDWMFGLGVRLWTSEGPGCILDGWGAG